MSATEREAEMPPTIKQVGDKPAPCCGRCGTPWANVGYRGAGIAPEYRELRSWSPRCQCWRDGRWHKNDAGARISAPPAPIMPVVSDEAARASYDAYGAARGYEPGPPGTFIGIVVDAEVAGLRAAFPIMLRDTMNALPRSGKYTLVPAVSHEGIREKPFYLDEATVKALLTALTGQGAER